MSDDRGYAKGPGGVPPLSGQEDHRDGGDTWGGWGVGIYPSGVGTGSRKATPHKGLN